MFVVIACICLGFFGGQVSVDGGMSHNPQPPLAYFFELHFGHFKNLFLNIKGTYLFIYLFIYFATHSLKMKIR